MEELTGLNEISGTVQSVVYQNDENGYTVLRLDTGETDTDAVTVVGTLPFAAAGERLKLAGTWAKHPTHGEQFKAERAERSLPREANAIYEYLASGTVRGIGPATAALIVERFGDETLTVIEKSPELLAGIRGVSMKKAQGISEDFRRQSGLRRLMEFLARNGLRALLAVRLYRFYGDSAFDFLNNNPYILAGGHIGATFAEADELALRLGVEPDSPNRIAAAILFELSHNSNNGHSFIPCEKLIPATAGLISADPELVEESLDVLADCGDVERHKIAGRDGCYLPRLYEAEVYVADRLTRMAEFREKTDVDVEALIAGVERGENIEYAPMQRHTLNVAAKRRVMVITGGPGTGKTTSVRAILALFDRLGLHTVLAAPTGRAAKRMSELTGRDASTVHRLLEAGYADGIDELVFKRDEKDPLKVDAVILDECSMVDITLMRALLAAMPETCRLVMVGDADQLPSVGPGNVFLDVIRSKMVETVRLTEIFRQTEGSRIVSNAHMIIHGEHPELRQNSGDFFFLRRTDPRRTADTIVELCTVRLPQNMGIAPADIQVLTPTRRNETGTANLNRRLQEALNPAKPGKNEKKFGEIVFRTGDRVMQIRNNYDIICTGRDGQMAGTGVFNGDIGYITSIDTGEGILKVDFDDKTASYSFDMLPELEHAFAMTVHKSQGSEYKAVVFSASNGPRPLMHRGVLYTAVTRARELLVVVGDDAALCGMIDNQKQAKRYSGLRARLAIDMN